MTTSNKNDKECYLCLGLDPNTEHNLNMIMLQYQALTDSLDLKKCAKYANLAHRYKCYNQGPVFLYFICSKKHNICGFKISHINENRHFDAYQIKIGKYHSMQPDEKFDIDLHNNFSNRDMLDEDPMQDKGPYYKYAVITVGVNKETKEVYIYVHSKHYNIAQATKEAEEIQEETCGNHALMIAQIGYWNAIPLNNEVCDCECSNKYNETLNELIGNYTSVQKVVSGF
jgi:hypothetical protein